jgi:predicted DNA-binding protein YlxM (UPF0122 family)
MTCASCDTRPECSSMCDSLKQEMKKVGQVMERHGKNTITVYPSFWREVQASCMGEAQCNRISNDDAMPYRTDFIKQVKTGIFIERFFNKLPVSEIAEKYEISEQAVRQNYHDAVETVCKIIDVMETRRSGINGLKHRVNFSDKEKFFLLTYVFGFTNQEVADMFGKHRANVSRETRAIADKYREAFDGIKEGKCSTPAN